MGTTGDCPRCGRPLEDAEGRRVRSLDLEFDKRLAALDAQSWRRTWKGSAWAFAITAGIYVVPPWVAFAGTLLLLFQLIYVRLAIVGPYRRHFGTGRRIVTRWLSRFGITAAAVHYPYLVFMPGLNVVVVPLLFGGLCAAAWWYHRWHLVRERERLPVSFFEKVLLWLAGLFLIASLVLAGLLIWAITGIASAMSGG